VALTKVIFNVLCQGRSHWRCFGRAF